MSRHVIVLICFQLLLSHVLHAVEPRFVQKSACPLGGKEGFIFNETSSSSKSIASMPPVVYIKTVKTGSSTVANILHRMADIRDAVIMIPADLNFLGWPHEFPGLKTAERYTPHSVDMILNHAVLNRPVMDTYMRRGSDNSATVSDSVLNGVNGSPERGLLRGRSKSLNSTSKATEVIEVLRYPEADSRPKSRTYSYGSNSHSNSHSFSNTSNSKAILSSSSRSNNTSAAGSSKAHIDKSKNHGGDVGDVGDKSFYFTTIREPYSLQKSAYNFFRNYTIDKNITWPMHIDYIRQIQGVRFFPAVFFRNPLALDLGWYARMRGKTDHDYKDDAIEAYVHFLDKNLDLVIALEQLDRGLVLLGHYLNVSLNELVSLKMKGNKDSESYVTPPVEEDATYKEAIYDINKVDVKIYEHFAAKFESQWMEASRDVATAKLLDGSIMLLEDRVKLLQSYNKQLSALCAEDVNFVNRPECNVAFITDSTEYGDYLWNFKYLAGQRDAKVCATDGTHVFARAQELKK